MTISARLALAFSILPTFIFAVNIFAAEAYRFELDFTTSLPDGNVPVSPNIDFAQLIQNAGIPGVLDTNSISVVNMATGQSIPFARTEDFSYGDSGHLEWPIKEPTHTNYEVRFRTTGSRPALIPQIYTPPVGVGDLLRYNASEPRPIGMIYPSGLVDLTGDGKLDYVGTWNYAHEPGWPWDGVICYPGVGDEGSFNFGDLIRIRYVDYAGSTDYKYLSNIYMTADFADFNGDGLTDLAFCPTYTGTVSFYLNSGARDPGGMPVFVASGSASTGTNDFEPCRAVDLNNDGAMDFVINNKWLKNTNPSQWPVQLSSPQSLNVGHYSCFYDVDADGWRTFGSSGSGTWAPVRRVSVQ